MMYPTLFQTIQNIQNRDVISDERQNILKPLLDYIQGKVAQKQEINLNFICTHNSRRSHLSQIWAQVAAQYFEIPQLYCYSGGTQATALFPKIVETLQLQGFDIMKLTEGNNPIYAFKYAENGLPIIGFSKKHDSEFNPKNKFAAILTCSNADEGCPYIAGAEIRIPITYQDPKMADGTDAQADVYAQRSLEIAAEMFAVFSKIKV